MDGGLIALAVAGAHALVGVMVTDAWGGVREGAVSLWRRFRPGEAEEVRRELEAARGEVTGASGGASESAVRMAEAQWAARLGELLTRHPEAAPQLRALIGEASGAEREQNAITASGTGAVAARNIGGNVTTHTHHHGEER